MGVLFCFSVLGTSRSSNSVHTVNVLDNTLNRLHFFSLLGVIYGYACTASSFPRLGTVYGASAAGSEVLDMVNHWHHTCYSAADREDRLPERVVRGRGNPSAPASSYVPVSGVIRRSNLFGRRFTWITRAAQRASWRRARGRECARGAGSDDMRSRGPGKVESLHVCPRFTGADVAGDQ